MPDESFTPGERVTVSTGLNIVGGQSGVVHFTVATPAGRLPNAATDCRADRGDVLRFHSRPDLTPVAVHVTNGPRIQLTATSSPRHGAGRCRTGR